MMKAKLFRLFVFLLLFSMPALAEDGYDEFVTRVPLDRVFIVFAGENNTMPSSIMGHIFIKFSGVSDGKLREHAFSYFANDTDTKSPKFYYDALVNGIDGTYALSPYAKKIKDYLEVEQRPIWELELDLNDEEKADLHSKLWALKGQNISYSFLNHNCGTGTAEIIAMMKPELPTLKFLATPIDYIKIFDEAELIKDVSVIPSHEYQIKSAGGAPKNILDAKKSSQIYVGTSHIRYMPVYQDFYDVSKAYYDDIESKLLSFDFAYDDGFYLDKIDVISMRSIVHKLPSKYLKFAFENAVGVTDTAIKPVFEAGQGYAYGFWGQRIKPYILPKLGYRYDQVHNLYAAYELGVILKPIEDAKLVLAYEKYFDAKSDNRGFDEKLSADFAYLLFAQTTLYLKYAKYSDNGDDFEAGIGYNF